MDDLVLIGTVKKVRGIKGDLKVQPMSDIPGRFSELSEVLIKFKQSAGVEGYKVEKAEPVNDYVVLKLKGIDSFDSAASLVGGEVMVHDSQRGVPEPGSYFVDSLIGMHVTDSEGSEVGVVEDLLSNFTQSILVIRSDNGRQFQIPFVSAFVKDVDLDAKKIRVELIEGLI